MTPSVDPRPQSRSQNRLTRWGDRLGRWNPQLLRQLRGVITTKAVILAIVVSLAFQTLTWLSVVSTVDSLVMPKSNDAQLKVSAETIYAVEQCIQIGSSTSYKSEDWSTNKAIEQCGAGQPAEVVDLIRNYAFGLRSNFYCTGSEASLQKSVNSAGVIRDYSDSPLCIPDGKGAYLVNWPALFGDGLPFVRGLFLTLMALGGAYAIAQSWLREAKLGTLEFIRMSPEPVGRILLGKVLGAPILCLIAALAWIPFHLYLAFSSNTPIFEWFAADLLGLAALSTVFVGALTACIWTGGLNVMLLALVLLPMFCGGWLLGLAAMPKELFPHTLTWFGIELTQSPSVALVVGIVVAIAATAVLWQSACRRFDNPQITPLPRIQAYFAMALFNAISLGFAWPVTVPILKSSHFIDVWGPVGFFWIVIQMFTTWGTTPQRQTLLDWSRYHHMQKSRRLGFANGIGQWIWGDRSPNLVVPVVNLMMTWVIWSPWAVVLWTSYRRTEGLALLAGLMIPTLMAVFFIALSTWCLLTIPRQPGVLIARVVVAYLTMSVVVMIIFAGSRSSMVIDAQSWWPILLTALGTIMLPATTFSAYTLNVLALAGLASMVASGSMVAIAQNTLRKVGASESKALFSSDPEIQADTLLR
ncbi:MAG: hypothetical protein AAF889_00440 [Cyanobacteria bacterium P01_D01_bin.73]